MITAENISKSYNKKIILNKVDFTAHANESVVIVGQNGAGKSTLLSILAGFLKPDEGFVSINNGVAAFCPQQDNLFDELTVKDNLRFWQNVRKQAVKSESINLAKLLGVNDYLNKKIRFLSGGMKKCVAILCALTNDSTVIILDEPFAGLDIFYKDILLKAFDELKNSGKCIIYTSHNIDEIMGINNDIYTLANGSLIKIEKMEKGNDYEFIRQSLLEHSSIKH